MLLNKKQFFINKQWLILLIVIFMIGLNVKAQKNEIYVWKDIPKESLEKKAASDFKFPSAFRAVEFDMEKLRELLLEADKFSKEDIIQSQNRDKIVGLLPTIILPTSEGGEIEFRLFDSGSLPKEYKEKNNYDLLSISGMDINGKGISVGISFSKVGVSMMIAGTHQKTYINKFNYNYREGNKCPTLIYYAKDEGGVEEGRKKMKCFSNDVKKKENSITNKQVQEDHVLSKYTIILSTTAEFSQHYPI